MAGCEADNPGCGAASQFLPRLKLGYRQRGFTGRHLHFHGSPRRRGESATTMNWSVKMNSKKHTTVKRTAAVVGGGALVTMGALVTSIHQQPSGAENVAGSKMTMAATTT